MNLMTSMKVSPATRDELKAMASRDGLTVEAALRKLLRAERQRQMGRDLAERSASPDERAVVQASNAAVARAIG